MYHRSLQRGCGRLPPLPAIHRWRFERACYDRWSCRPRTDRSNYHPLPRAYRRSLRTGCGRLPPLPAIHQRRFERACYDGISCRRQVGHNYSHPLPRVCRRSSQTGCGSLQRESSSLPYLPGIHQWRLVLGCGDQWSYRPRVDHYYTPWPRVNHRP